ncbi:MAG: DNA polymerase III subunit delta [Endomicrobiaceae bacterium]|nr:DNA polymerase III subunit delta [Endomicrobiaceae bacterium]
MKFSTVSMFRKNLSAKKMSPVYFLAGEETFLLDDCIKRIENIINIDDLNREVFQATENTGSDILNSVETLPFLTDKRIVILKSANKLKNEDFKIITKIIENPVDTTCFIIIFPDKVKNSTSKRKDLITLCENSNSCYCVECKKMYEKDVKAFIQEEFNSRGKTIEQDVVQQIVNDTGFDLQNVSNEIEKISLYLGKDKKNVTVEDFVKISGFTKEINIFMLTNSIEEKNLKNSLFIIEQMLKTGESAIGILSAISGAVRKMLTAKSLIEEKNYTSQDALNYIRVYSYFQYKYMNNLSKYTLLHLKKSLQEILKTDISLKTGKTDDKSALENLVLFICK